MSLDPVTAGIDLGKSLVNLGSEFIIDKDKQIEFNYKARELVNGFHVELLKTQTIPWVDALIKFMLATKGLYRPAGAFILALVGSYFAYKQIDIPEWLYGVLFGAGPAWGWSRHEEKKERARVQEIIAIQKKSPGWFYDDDLQ